MKTQMKKSDAEIFPNAKFMKKAISLAKKGEGFTNPNPLVGAVIEKNGKILAAGFHHKYGALHAERDALFNLAKKIFWLRQKARRFMLRSNRAAILENSRLALRQFWKRAF